MDVETTDDLAADTLVRLSDEDNVAIARFALPVGSRVEKLVTRSDVPRGHKVAVREIAAGEAVRKYTQVIGYAKSDIPEGGHVHDHNVAFRNTDHEYEFSTAAHPVDYVPEAERATFRGFRRPSGKVGTRNYIGVLTSVNCSASAASYIADHFTDEVMTRWPNVDGVVSFVHGTGCGMASSGEGFENIQRVLWGYARNPNLAGVLLIGLGCEVVQIDLLMEAFGIERSDMFRTMTIQGEGGIRPAVTKGIEEATAMCDIADSFAREDCPVSELTVALQCGGSDAWSGVTSNPALGYAADKLVRHGGTVALAETPEVYGAEHLLTRRAIDRETGQKLVDRILWWEDYTQKNGGSMDNNPSPGNMRGGLTTILEKSLGAVAKAGTTPLTGFYLYGEEIDRKGFVHVDSPGFDPASVTGQVASGCNLVAFTTGRGSCFGCKPAPSIKISSNSETYNRMPEDMDVNAGRIVSDGAQIEEVGEEIFDLLIQVASGEESLSEKNGMGDMEFVPWQIGAVM